MSSNALDDQYLDWLYAMVGLQEENVRHNKLLNQLFSREFVIMIPNDDNRCKDGLALRQDFIKSPGRLVRIDRQWLGMGCSVLELMIGVARHLSFEAEGEVGEWFWHLIENLGLTRYNDHRWHAGRIDQIVERLVWRQYSHNGNGGLFPLKNPHEDQRQVEIWFQMEAYILELD